MELKAFRHGDTLRVDVGTSRIDAACAIQFKDRMREVCGDEPRRVVLNFAAVDFLDSSGLGAVVATMKMLGKSRTLELSGLSSKVSKVFRLTRMDTVFTIHDTVETALGAGDSAA
ncbi:anti-sigma B factor antagonist [Aliiruegeria haliotis]|uniref:Anti-sigma factor antagonist n=1 Tax=Aliiruegeria haliotis TaxID=1280846 RepID=A0A2T0RIF1_9RHOB|nr:STAS domain-containing protein [Aliiruegeria haliotis]PRY20907.1 anti-sigma B factor antagonist [Aliiruegeria haliotis]